MVRKDFLLLLLAAGNSLAYASERYEQLHDQSGLESSESSCPDLEDLVIDELTALELGTPLENDIQSDLLRKALRHNVFRTKEDREKLDKMAKNSPPGFQLLAQLFSAQLPLRGPGGVLEPFEKTPAHVRSAPSMRLDQATQKALQEALKQYQLEKNYEQLKAWLDTAHIENDDLRLELAQALQDKKKYKDKARLLEKQLKKINTVKNKD